MIGLDQPQGGKYTTVCVHESEIKLVKEPQLLYRLPTN